jgi:glycosyltransferase
MKLSILTAILDGDKLVHETARAMLETLALGNVEWVIKDSRSAFNTDLLPLANLDGVKLVARTDDSLYDALNQALQTATGDYFMVLGAGDTLRPSAPRALSSMLTSLGGEFRSGFFPIYHVKRQELLPARPDLIHIGMTTPHPGCILNTDGAREIGCFDSRYRIAADYDLVVRYLRRWSKFVIAQIPIIDFLGGGLSERYYRETALETALIRERIILNSPSQ